jgi:drug/metabolite transporter (DMT)-like permease
MAIGAHYKGFWYGIVAALTNAAIALVAKGAEGISVEVLVFARFFVSLLILLPVVRRQRIRVEWRRLPGHLVRGVAGLAAMYCYFFAVQRLPVVTALTLTNTAPLFIPLGLLVWLRLVIPKQRLVGVALGFAGVVALLRPQFGGQAVAEWVGLGGGVAMAIAYIGLRQLTKSHSPYEILFYYFGISTVLSALPLPWVWEPIRSPHLWGALFLLGLLSALLQFCLTHAMSLMQVSKVSATTYFSVVFGTIGGWLFFGEAPDWWTALGALLIVLGGVVSLFDHTPPRRL